MTPLYQRASAARVTAPALAHEVLGGLLGSPKTLPAKLFYDARGASLFEEICEQPEYYLTRAELEILRRHATDIAALSGPDAVLIEYGSGAGIKVRSILDALEQPAAYVPVDISQEQLVCVARDVGRDYPGLRVRPVYADYTRRFVLPDVSSSGRRLAFFPGSTIGNFHPAEASVFLTRVRHAVGAGGALVLGVDRQKDPRVLHAAYNDQAGVTAAFNLNMLTRLNDEFGPSFDASRFSHRAYYNREAARIEMHLVSTLAQTVRIGGATVSFENGETIWTESSYKYGRDALETLVATAGFRMTALWTDSRKQFWVTFLTAER